MRAVFGIYEETGAGNVYINNKVVPYPGPVGSGGAREAPLQSSLADGFHSSGSFRGPTLIQNTFTNMGDDGIAIHGRYYLVVGVCAITHMPDQHMLNQALLVVNHVRPFSYSPHPSDARRNSQQLPFLEAVGTKGSVYKDPLYNTLVGQGA